MGGQIPEIRWCVGEQQHALHVEAAQHLTSGQPMARSDCVVIAILTPDGRATRRAP
jgi:hypothetical protein